MTTFSPITTYIRLLRYLRPVLHIFILGLMATFFTGFLDGFLGIYMRPLIDGLANSDRSVIRDIPFYLLYYFTIRALMGFLSLFCLYQAGNYIMSTLRQEAFMRFMGSRFASVKDTNVGGFLSLLNYNVSQVEEATTGTIRKSLKDVVQIITSVVALFYVSPLLTLIMMTVLPIALVIMRIFSYKTHKEAENVQTTLGHVIRYAEQSVHAVSTIRSMSAYDHVLSRFDVLLGKTLKHQKRFTVTSSLTHALLQFITGLPLVIVFASMAYGWMEFNAADVGAFFYTIIKLMQPVRGLSLVSSQFQKGVAAAASVFKICDLQQEHHIGDVPFQLDTIHLRHVDYVISDRVIFKDLNISFEPDKIHVLIGPSGVGKSTLLSLIAQLPDLDNGELYVGSIPYKSIDIGTFRRNVGYMDQLPFIWDDSIINNVIFPDVEWDPVEMDDDLVQKIFNLTSLTPWLETLPSKAHTIIGADTLMPSGGQKQRIALARVLYHKPQIILLDEPASAVDEKTAHKIIDYLESVKQGRIIIVTNNLWL